MTEATHVETPSAPPAEPFDSDDIHGFQSDDREAIKNIGKMLVAFFFYSLIVMILVTLFTARSWF